jgi:hypothetical protein
MVMVEGTAQASCELHCHRLADDTLLMQLADSWTFQAGIPGVPEIQLQLDTTPQVRRRPRPWSPASSG